MPRVPYNSVGGFSTGLTMTGVIDSLGNITGVSATFSGLIRANAGISAAGGVTLAGTLKGVTATFSGNLTTTGSLTTLGDSNDTGITAYSNDQVIIVGNNYQYALKSLGGSTSGIIVTFSGGQNIEAIVNYWQSGYNNVTGNSHTFIINAIDGEFGISSFDYTESILGSNGSVVFTLTSVDSVIKITATTPALGKFYSAFQFKTSIRKSGSY